jgi:hypothetical protein
MKLAVVAPDADTARRFAADRAVPPADVITIVVPTDWRKLRKIDPATVHVAIIDPTATIDTTIVGQILTACALRVAKHVKNVPEKVVFDVVVAEFQTWKNSPSAEAKTYEQFGLGWTPG